MRGPPFESLGGEVIGGGERHMATADEKAGDDKYLRYDHIPDWMTLPHSLHNILILAAMFLRDRVGSFSSGEIRSQRLVDRLVQFMQKAHRINI